MATQKQASIGALTSIGVRLEVSFDGNQTFKRIFGVYNMNTTGGDAQSEERQPLDSKPYRRASRRGNQDLNVTLDDLSWMAGIRRVEDYLDREESFTIRLVRPEIILSSWTGAVQAAIASVDGAVTITGANAPDLLEAPYGVANGIQIANRMYIIDSITYDSVANTTITKVDPAPASDVAEDDFTLVRPGLIYGPVEVVGGNLNLDLTNAGSVQQSAVFHLSGRIGSPTEHIGLQ